MAVHSRRDGPVACMLAGQGRVAGRSHGTSCIWRVRGLVLGERHGLAVRETWRVGWSRRLGQRGNVAGGRRRRRGGAKGIRINPQRARRRRLGGRGRRVSRRLLLRHGTRRRRGWAGCGPGALSRRRWCVGLGAVAVAVVVGVCDAQAAERLRQAQVAIHRSGQEARPAEGQDTVRRACRTTGGRGSSSGDIGAPRGHEVSV
jgi:hypothetical protein